jgi:LysM repeat protein
MSADTSNGLVPLGTAGQSNALTSATPSTPHAAASDDRYGSASTPTAPPTAFAPVTPVAPSTTAAGTTFAASWPAIQAALDRNDLKQAHQLLSKWHGDESLSPAESQKVETLLNQLAGTVIYSTDHRLEPARVVKPGESLETIAKEYGVPWQLLGKINGIAAPDQVRPGQSLKVVRGPFSATVDLHRNQLTLELDGRYAGSFTVTVPPGSPVSEGQWLVDQKLQGLPGAVTPSAYSSAPAAANDCAIVLRNAAGTAASSGGSLLMIASSSAASAPGAPSIRVTPQDAEDIADILSVGSRIVVRR